MRARYPDVEDVVVRDGVRIGYEVYGSGAPTILLPTSNPIVHARQWKAQVPFLARHFRVVVVDGRGNGRSDRPVGPAAYTVEEDVADLVAVLDATGTDRAVVVGLSRGARRGLALAAAHPDRVAGVVALAPASIEHDVVRSRAPSMPTTPASSRSSTRWCSPTRTPPSGSRTPSTGAWRPPRTSWSTTSPRRPAGLPSGLASCAEPSAARCSSCTAPTTGSCPTRSAPRWPNGPAVRW